MKLSALIVTFAIGFCSTKCHSAFVFFKQDHMGIHSVSEEEYAKAQSILEETEFTHLQDKKRQDILTAEEAETLNAHFADNKKPFYEKEMIQDKLNERAPGIQVCYLPDTVVQLVTLRYAKSWFKEKMTEAFTLIPIKKQMFASLNALVIQHLKDKPFFKAMNNHIYSSAETLFNHFQGAFRSLINEVMTPEFFAPDFFAPDFFAPDFFALDYFKMKGFSIEKVYGITENMIKLELLAQYEHALVLIRATPNKGYNGLVFLDSFLYDEEMLRYVQDEKHRTSSDKTGPDKHTSIAVSYNYSLFAGYFDITASTYRIGLSKGMNLYAVLVRKNKSHKNTFDLFYLPAHNPLHDIFTSGEHFHPRTLGRTGSGSALTTIIRSQTPAARHDISHHLLKKSLLKSRSLDISLLSEEEKAEYNELIETNDLTAETINRRQELQAKMMVYSPKRLAHASQNAVFSNVKEIDLSLLTADEQKEYEKLKNKIALSGAELQRFQELGNKTRSNRPEKALTLNVMRRGFETAASNNLVGPDADNIFANEDYLELPLLDILANDSIIVAIQANPVNFTMQFPTEYPLDEGQPDAQQLATALAKDQQGFYELKIRRSERDNFMREKAEYQYTKDAPLPNAKKAAFFAPSENAYKVDQKRIANLQNGRRVKPYSTRGVASQQADEQQVKPYGTRDVIGKGANEQQDSASNETGESQPSDAPAPASAELRFLKRYEQIIRKLGHK